MTQRWENLLFVHWSVSPEVMKSYLPTGLELDTYDGKAWISVVSFKVDKVRLRYLPRVPFVRSMFQVNVRTYVKKNGERGVYFFSLETNKFLAVLGARMATLPFFRASIIMKKWKNFFYLRSIRNSMDQKRYKVQYNPIGDKRLLERDGLDFWLLERYILWTYKSNTLYRADIRHKSWKVRDVQVNIKHNSLLSFLPNNAIEHEYYAHYAESKEALIWMIHEAKGEDAEN
ncbi:YqjF family protein [Oceanobacillus senegalensis]|uniref:YqjF family protein n=1 Tax=Oceanobacillus senegalensis TaxID=1936063 RepID=UPI002481C130|nr:DUF2071 domain-containing protein [Oceanobacillus senegalensis]